jgi:hypothetical protein
VPVTNAQKEVIIMLIDSLRNNNTCLTYTTYNAYDQPVDFVFQYRRAGLSWRAYIVESPSYGYQSGDPIITHRNFDENNAPYVCWTNRLKSFEEAKQVSGLWAEATVRYIDTGARF